MSKISVRDRNKNMGRKPNWGYRFEIAKVNGKRQWASESGFRTKKEAEEAGAKAFADYNGITIQNKYASIIIADNGRIICRAYIEQVCRKISKQLGKNITFHCLRHSNTTTLYENGVPVKAIQQRLGHKSPETTMKTYAHNTQKMTDIAVSTIDDCLIHSLNSCGQNVDTLLN